MDSQTYDAMMTLLRSIDEKADGMIERQDRTNGRINELEPKVAALEATCAARGTCAQRAGFVMTWKIALVLALSILVAGALMGTEGAKAIAAVVK